MISHEIFFVSNTYWSLWNFRRNLINDLTEKNFKVTLIGKKDSSYSKFLNENISLHFIADLKFVSSIFFIFYTVALIVWKKPKVVFSFTHLGNISAGLASKFTTFKFVANLSGLGRVYSVGSKKSFLQPFLTFLIKLSMNGASTIFVQNTEDQAWLSNLIPHKANQIKLLPGSGTDLDRFSYCAPQSIVRSKTKNILMMSRLLPEKGVDWFLKAAKELNSPDLTFILVGASDLTNLNMKRDVLNYHDKGLISYLGHVDDVLAHIQNAFCVVLPSRYREGTPKSLIEALACGKPIITTDMPGCRTTVDRNGMLVSTYNGFVEALRLLISKSEIDYFALCKNSRELAERNFDEQIIIKYYREEI